MHAFIPSFRRRRQADLSWRPTWSTQNSSGIGKEWGKISCKSQVSAGTKNIKGEKKPKLLKSINKRQSLKCAEDLKKKYIYMANIDTKHHYYKSVNQTKHGGTHL